MIYFDNAATTWPKPSQVIKEVETTMRFRGGNPSRSGHPMAAVAGKVIYRTREALASHFGTEPERVIFFPGATYALNTAMKAVIGAGDHFLISDMEHNAVLRPAHTLASKGAAFDTFDALSPPEAMLREIERKLRPNTVAIVCIHACNAAPLPLPAAEIGALCHRKGLLFILDAAQSAGHAPIHMENMQIDALCIPGHKGLMGPQGCGCMLLSRRMAACLADRPTLIEGGSGTQSMDPTMPRVLPERYEPGTQPTPLIAGLRAGVCLLEKIGYDEIMEREEQVYTTLRSEMLNMPGVRLYLPEKEKGNIILFNMEGVPCHTAGAHFDKEGICLRYGFHCAPTVHRKLETGPHGALRIGIGWNNTKKEAAAFLSFLWRLKKEKMV